MGIVVFIIVFLFVLGSWLILLRTANAHKLPKNIKPQPYDENDDV